MKNKVLAYKKHLKVIGVVFFTLIIFAGISCAWICAAYPQKYYKDVARTCETYGLDKSIIFAIIKAESGFNKNAVSKAGAIGLMQLMPTTAESIAKEAGIENFDEQMLYDSKINIMLGVCYYKKMLERFKDHSTALAAYNAGEGNVRAWLKDKKYSCDGVTLHTIPFKETDKYVEKVNSNQKVYKRILHIPLLAKGV